jgi:hypothetical protein
LAIAASLHIKAGNERRAQRRRGHSVATFAGSALYDPRLKPWSRLNGLAPVAGSAAANTGSAKVDIGGFVGQIELSDSGESFF